MKGYLIEGGVFRVMDVVFPAANPAPALDPENSGRYLALLSGLQLGKQSNSLLQHVLSQYLSGTLGPNSAEDASRIERVVVVGNSVYKNLEAVTTGWSSNNTSASENKALTQAIAELDEILDNIAYKGAELDVMPGNMDPQPTSLPQQPLKPMMLPNTTNRKTV
jgi:DNA polymerase II small subunit/DNA polymerase delta subunit B